MTRVPLLLTALVLAGCASAPRPTYGPRPSGPTAIATQATVATLSSRTVGRLGLLVVDPAGDTLYANADEKSPGSGCDAVCRRTWPLLLAPAGGPVAVTGAAVERLVGTVTLAGERVLSYGGHVLHRYVGDAGSGGAEGQNVQGVWAAVTVSGLPAAGVP